MKRVISAIFTAVLALSLANTSLMADPAKGQKTYLKYMKGILGFDGTKFAIQHTQDEWKALFEGKGEKFVEEYSTKYPALKEFLGSEKFEKSMQDIKDFCIEYASDSGNVPSC